MTSHFLEIGRIYEVNHYRKGKFTIMVTKLDEEFATGLIVSGKANAILDHNIREMGEEITFRRSFATFKILE